jgi:hypothetical protein
MSPYISGFYSYKNIPANTEYKDFIIMELCGTFYPESFEVPIIKMSEIQKWMRQVI